MTFFRTAFAETGAQFQYKINPNAELPIKRQCELLGISRLTYEYKPIEPTPEAVIRQEKIMGRIDEIHTLYPYMGQRKITKLLNKEGFKVGRKLVRSYMLQMGIHPIYLKQNLSKRNRKESVVPYLLRNMNIFMPNQVWSIFLCENVPQPYVSYGDH